MNGKPWTPVDLALLRSNFSDCPTKDVAGLIGRPYGAISGKAAKLGLRKSAAYLATLDANRLDGVMGMGTRFVPGAKAWNKGLQGVAGIQAGCRATQFKKGRPANEAHNYVPIGSLRLSKDGYLERKVTDEPKIVPARRWVFVHRLIWEAAHGVIPPGGCVVFRDGLRTNVLDQITLCRLELLTRSELMRRNSFQNQCPPEIARLVQLRGALTRAINRKVKTL